MDYAVTTSQDGAFFPGNDTRLCGSMFAWQRADKHSVRVKTIHPKNLPVSDIVKIDTEGSEVDIIENLQFTPAYLVVEYHSKELGIACLRLCKDNLKMELADCKSDGKGLGLLKFVRRK